MNTKKTILMYTIPMIMAACGINQHESVPEKCPTTEQMPDEDIARIYNEMVYTQTAMAVCEETLEFRINDSVYNNPAANVPANVYNRLHTLNQQKKTLSMTAARKYAVRCGYNLCNYFTPAQIKTICEIVPGVQPSSTIVDLCIAVDSISYPCESVKQNNVFHRVNRTTIEFFGNNMANDAMRDIYTHFMPYTYTPIYSQNAPREIVNIRAKIKKIDAEIDRLENKISQAHKVENKITEYFINAPYPEKDSLYERYIELQDSLQLLARQKQK
ncbi:MAG: hypothetical protein IJ560_00590 [Alphaproteobacteria bacterium]|nr:hypothetical protein [Alphaproteobacteria bacterium]